jgi:hypothetical protein
MRAPVLRVQCSASILCINGAGRIGHYSTYGETCLGGRVPMNEKSGTEQHNEWSTEWLTKKGPHRPSPPLCWVVAWCWSSSSAPPWLQYDCCVTCH